jgi:hypothetical protein
MQNRQNIAVSHASPLGTALSSSRGVSTRPDLTASQTGQRRSASIIPYAIQYSMARCPGNGRKTDMGLWAMFKLLFGGNPVRNDRPVAGKRFIIRRKSRHLLSSDKNISYRVMRTPLIE